MQRQELYRKIKELGIAKKIEEKFHQNFTRVSNAKLESFIKEFTTKANKAANKAAKKGSVVAVSKVNIVMVNLVSTLQAKRILTATEADNILKML